MTARPRPYDDASSFGGTENEVLGGVGLDPSGNVVLAGFRQAADGVTGAAAAESVFVVKIHP